MGEEEGWTYMDALHENIAVYTHSGSKPCKQAAAGEYPIGLSFEYRAREGEERGCADRDHRPDRGRGLGHGSAGHHQGHRQARGRQGAARLVPSPRSEAMYNEGYAVVAMPGLAKPMPNFPEESSSSLIENDFDWAATNRERILAEWQQALRQQVRAEDLSG